jgi:hypothetical protein
MNATIPTETATKKMPLWQGLLWLGLIALLALTGLCTIFASVATLAQAWQEHAQAGSPEAVSYVDRCYMHQTSTGRRDRYYIDCRLSYALGNEQNFTHIYSMSVPDSDVWQYPRNQIGPFERWVDEHPEGTPIVVRYNPANHRKAVMVSDYMPGSGPRTLVNVKLVEAFGGSFFVLLIITRLLKSRFVMPNKSSSVRLNSSAPLG